MAAGPGHAAEGGSKPARVHDLMTQRVAACTACHGDQGRAAPDGYYPRIAGKPAGYLYNQLINFREGRRQYPLMTYIVEHLSEPYLMQIATHFSALHPPYPPPPALKASPELLERGRILATQGDRSRNIPACSACHGEGLTGVMPSVPGLLGLPHDYLNAQFGAWRNGTRRAAAPDCMAQIATRLSAEDVNAAAVWLATRPVPDSMRPLPALPEPMPMECGSVPVPEASR